MTRPPAGFDIRPATRKDVPAIHELIAALAEYEHLSHLCVATEADLDRALFGSPARAEVLVGTKEGATVAFALFFHNYSTFLGRPGLWLEDLFVRPEYRRQGCAQALLRALAGIAKARGCGRFEWSVLDWNAPAIAFYETLGASILPDWRIARVVGPALDSMVEGTRPIRPAVEPLASDGG